MQNDRIHFILSWILIFSSAVIFTSCNNVAPQVLELTRIVPQTVVVTEIVKIIVTSTPIPASPTPQPTNTPQPTPTTTFVKWTSNQVIEAFKASGLEAENTHPMTKDDYGLAPMVALEGIRFFIPSLCEDCGGRIMSFSSKEDLKKTREFYVKMGQESAILFSWTFVKDNILVQINGDLPEQKANQYEAALANLQ